MFKKECLSYLFSCNERDVYCFMPDHELVKKNTFYEISYNYNSIFSSYCYAQKQYEFDYLIEYELTFYKDSIKIKNRPFREKDETIKKYYLTNSKKKIIIQQ